MPLSEEQKQQVRREAKGILQQARNNLDKAETKQQTLDILREAGANVGYKPAFRALIMGTSIEEAIRW